MARTFGNNEDGNGNKGGEDQNQNRRGQEHPSHHQPLPPPPQQQQWSHPVGAAAMDPHQNPPPLQPPPLAVIQDVADEGRHLYMDFIRREMTRNGLHDECSDITGDGGPNGVDPEKMLQWIRAGRELRHLADEFAKSKERDVVRNKAASVSIETLDMEHFMNLLQELFQGGRITRERIVVLFFFCADLAIQALRQGLHQTFHRLVQWSLRYIATQVAAWVHSCGGWVVVLRSGLDMVYRISACCAFVAVAVACVVYIRRNL